MYPAKGGTTVHLVVDSYFFKSRAQSGRIAIHSVVHSSAAIWQRTCRQSRIVNQLPVPFDRVFCCRGVQRTVSLAREDFGLMSPNPTDATTVRAQKMIK